MQVSLSHLSIIALALAAPTLAAPVNNNELSGYRGEKCGNNEYDHGDVELAAQAACKRLREKTVVGRSNYPHRYFNGEGFTFLGARALYYEFPILKYGEYKGDNPGPDRVVIDDRCRFAGLITHSGATGNGFVGCSKTK